MLFNGTDLKQLDLDTAGWHSNITSGLFSLNTSTHPPPRVLMLLIKRISIAPLCNFSKHHAMEHFPRTIFINKKLFYKDFSD